MKISLAFVSLALSSFSNALVPGTLQLGLEMRTAPLLPALGRRQTLQAPLIHSKNDLLFFANISVGSPPQDLYVLVDTGSSDLWLPSPDICRTGSCHGGFFDSSKSTTFKNITDYSGTFYMEYGDFSVTTGDYFTDILTIGDESIVDLTIGLVTKTNIRDVGILGLGSRLKESSALRYKENPHPTFLDAMVDTGIISSCAYSLWLDDLDSSSASILFGGIDTSKYFGDLVSFEALKSEAVGLKNVTDFIIPWTTVTTSSTGDIVDEKYSEFSIPQHVLLDSGSNFILVPEEIARSLQNEVSATVEGIPADIYVEELAFIPCSLRSQPGYVKFGFGQGGTTVIQVPLSELVLPWNYGLNSHVDHRVVHFLSGPHEGEEICVFGILKTYLPEGELVFGTSFLRSAYVVYDLANEEIAIAQTNFDPTGSNVVPFEYVGAPIPSAIGSDYSSTTQLKASEISNTSLVLDPSPSSDPTQYSASTTSSNPTMSLDQNLESDPVTSSAAINTSDPKISGNNYPDHDSMRRHPWLIVLATVLPISLVIFVGTFVRLLMKCRGVEVS